VVSSRLNVVRRSWLIEDDMQSVASALPDLGPGELNKAAMTYMFIVNQS
jgi:hypothetical protein